MKSIAGTIMILLCQCIGLNAQVINIPADYSTIQEGIDAASEGDTVLVSPGTYFENIGLGGKNITFASQFLVSGDTSHISSTIIDGGHDGSVISIGWGVDSTTLISGFTIANGQAYRGGGILIGSYSDPVFDHLRIVENYASDGGGAYFAYGRPQFRHCSIKGNSAGNRGGGMCINSSYASNPCKLVDVQITDNDAKYGGGVANFSNPVFEGVTITNNNAVFGGGFANYGDPQLDSVNRCNIFLNSAGVGNDLWEEEGWESTTPIVLDTFTVLTPTEFHVHNPGLFSFDILNSKFSQVEEDLYVSPSGSNENSGLTSDDPLKTIYHALTIILPNDSSQRNIHLLEGIYSPGTNQDFFPVNLIDHIDICGAADSLVILNADSLSRVINLFGNEKNTISGLTITGGSHSSGAGLLISNSSPVLEFLTVSGNASTGNGGGISVLGTGSNPFIDQAMVEGNSAVNGAGIYNKGTLELSNSSVLDNTGSGSGGGIFGGDSTFLLNTEVSGNEAEDGAGIYLEENSHADLDSVYITGNHGMWQGGGVYCGDNSILVIGNTQISGNYADLQGGGIFCQDGSTQEIRSTVISGNYADLQGGGIFNPSPDTKFDSIDRCSIFLNIAKIGNDLYDNNSMTNVIVDTFSVIEPTEFHASERDRFTFDILAGKVEQIDADIYVDPEGSNSNSGLTPGDPLKTIHNAYLKLKVDSNHLNTIHLANGVYSPSATGEILPVYMVNFSSMSGDDRNLTILDAENESRVISLYKDSIPFIRNMTIRNGNSGFGSGGGIYCYETEVTLDNVIIEECTTDDYGGGIYFGPYGRLTVLNSTVRNNTAETGGGIDFNTYSKGTFENSIIESNSADVAGGIFTYSDLEFDNVEFNYNSAIKGGAFVMHDTDSTIKIHIQNSRFRANSAESIGGGMYTSRCSKLTVVNTLVDSNTAAQGAGFYIRNTATEIRNSLFTDNIASVQWGGVAIDNSYNVDSYPDAELYNVTFANNSNIGLLGYRTGIKLVNSIFWGNTGPAQIQVTLKPNDNHTFLVDHSNIQDGEDGLLLSGPVNVVWSPGNIVQDPLFFHSGDHPYSLEDGSPCIDTGTPDTLGLNLPYNDIIGNTRIWDGDGDGVNTIDMGPYEYGAPVNVPQIISFSNYGAQDIRIYPNPTCGQITIKCNRIDTEREIFIINSIGIRVLALSIPKGNEISIVDINSLKQGIYQLIFMSDGKVFGSEKVMIISL